MCGRFTLTTPSDELAAAFPEFVLPPDLPQQFNIAPGQNVLTVPNTEDRRAAMYRWGLVPAWAKDPSVGHRLINARSETVAEKPSFRVPFKKRRCLILANGFFEWRKETGTKTPYYVRMKQGHPFAMAGLWDIWHPESGDTIRSCTILTTEANPLVREIHDRMPVILDPAAYARWLSPDVQAAYTSLRELLSPFPASKMEAWPVSTLVNSPANNSPECISPSRGLDTKTHRALF